MKPLSPSCATCKHCKHFANTPDMVHCVKHDSVYSKDSWCHDYITRVCYLISQMDGVLKENHSTTSTILQIAEILNTPGNRCFIDEYKPIEEYIEEHITIKRD